MKNVEEKILMKSSIRSLRKGLGVTQKDFAKILGVSHITVRIWESGRSMPNPLYKQILEKMSKKVCQGGARHLIGIVKLYEPGQVAKNTRFLLDMLGDYL